MPKVESIFHFDLQPIAQRTRIGPAHADLLDGNFVSLLIGHSRLGSRLRLRLAPDSGPEFVD